MAKVVIDANVIISAAYGGAPLEALVLALKEHEVYVSESIRRELENTFLKLSEKLSNEQIIFIQERIHQVVAMATLVPVSLAVTLSRDPTDDHYLSLCQEVEADFLITGDKDLLAIYPEDLKKNDIPALIVTPKSFLARAL